MKMIEHNNLVALDNVMNEVEQDQSISWGMARVKKNYLRPITDQAFIVAMTPFFQETDLAHIFFIDKKRVFLIWKNPQKPISKPLRAFIGATLLTPETKIHASDIVSVIDAGTHHDRIKAGLKKGLHAFDALFDEIEEAPPEHEDTPYDDSLDDGLSGSIALTATPAQTDYYHQLCKEKRYRKQLSMLVVEDKIFSQKLLCDVLRSIRIHNNNETPLVDVTDGIQEAWKIYLKKAPDIIFVDLGLSDGSGHTLTRAMKELDPGAHIIIVTAHNYEEELSVAKRNNVDGFIGKPYNKKQIFDCIQRYLNALKSSKDYGHGFPHQS